MELFKLLSTSEIVAQIIGFLILLTLLKVFAWKKVLNLLDERKNRIASEFEDINNTKAEIAKLRADYEARLAAIERSAQERIQEAIVQGKIISEEARKNAQISAQEIIDNAKTSVNYELAKAKAQLRDEIIDITIKATENLIREKLTGRQDKVLVENFIKEIEKAQ